MCDEITENELDAHLEGKGLTRRSFSLHASATLAATSFFATSCANSTGESSELSALVEEKVTVPTLDGEMDAVFIHPAKGAHAAVIIWPDIHGVDPGLYEMSRSLAGSGYAVLAANQYYRTHKGRLFEEGQSIRDPGGRELVMPHYRAVSKDTIPVDTRAIVTWLDAQKAVDTTRGIGAIGFCMTGSWTLRAAASLPERIRAASSFHGGGLATDKEDSPHLLAGQIKGGVLIAIAENDHERDPDAKDTLIEAFKAANTPAEIEVYADAMHGWVPPDSRAHNPEQAERVWGRMLALFERELS
jgi:carboxymethylenebutenolidase